jgi:acetylornithine deacetylase/succinyl-diaminopimelate desuccinylase-like protein
MKNIFIAAGIALFLTACKGPQTAAAIQPSSQDYKPYAESITAENLKTHLTVIASDEMEGRQTGSEGQKRAGLYLIEEYKKAGIGYPTGADSYYQPVPASFLNSRRNLGLQDSENIWAFIEGTDKKHEIVVVSAHYDHVGMKNGEVYNGADDDGSGTVAIMEVAKAFQKAKKRGKALAAQY